MERLFKVEELAEKLSLSIPVIRKYIREKKIRASKIGNSYVVTESAVEEFIKANEIK